MRWGALLNAPSHLAAGKTNDFARGTQQAGFCFIWRAAMHRSDHPTLRYYALTRGDIGSTISRAGIFRNAFPGVTCWIRTVSTQPLLIATRGWLVAFMADRPLVAFLRSGDIKILLALLQYDKEGGFPR